MLKCLNSKDGMHLVSPALRRIFVENSEMNKEYSQDTIECLESELNNFLTSHLLKHQTLKESKYTDVTVSVSYFLSFSSCNFNTVRYLGAAEKGRSKKQETNDHPDIKQRHEKTTLLSREPKQSQRRSAWVATNVFYWFAEQSV